MNNNPHVAAMKDTIFYKRQIQQKLPELLGMLSLDQDIPITHDFIGHLFENDQGEEESSDQYFQQIQYFIVEPLKVISQDRIKEIQTYLASYLKQAVTIINSNYSLQLGKYDNNFYFYYEINQKSAAIFVYKFIIIKENHLINIYPYFQRNDSFLNCRTCCLINQIESINTLFEFELIKIVSALGFNNQIIVKLQLGSTQFEIQLKQEFAIMEEDKGRYENPKLIIILKEKIFAILMHKIRGIQIFYKIELSYLFSQQNKKNYFQQQPINGVVLEKQLNMAQKIILIYESYYNFQITLNFDRTTFKLKDSLFSKGKEKTYVQNIIYAVSYAMRNRQQLKQSAVLKIFLDIIKEHRQKEIINQFQKAYKLVKEKNIVQKLGAMC